MRRTLSTTLRYTRRCGVGVSEFSRLFWSLLKIRRLKRRILMIERFYFEGLVCDTGYIGGGGGNRQNRGPAGRTAPIHIRPRSAPVKLDAPPPSRSAPHKLDLQPQYGIRPTIAHRPNPHSPQSTFAPDPPQLNWTVRTAPFQIRPKQLQPQ